jgi:hypothetical protein
MMTYSVMCRGGWLLQGTRVDPAYVESWSVPTPAVLAVWLKRDSRNICALYRMHGAQVGAADLTLQVCPPPKP